RYAVIAIRAAVWRRWLAISGKRPDPIVEKWLASSIGLALGITLTLSAQPRLTLDHPAIARRIVQQLALRPGERVLSIAHPGTFTELLPHIRYEVMRAGGIDLGVVDGLQEPVPESFDAGV